VSLFDEQRDLRVLDDIALCKQGRNGVFRFPGAEVAYLHLAD